MCVEETGRPSTEASSTIVAAASSAAKPEEGCIAVSPVPTVWITLRPTNHSPGDEGDAEGDQDGGGTAASCPISPVRSTSRTAAKGPTALAMSLAPWLKAKAQAVNTCIQLNMMKVAREIVCFFRARANTVVAIQTPSASIVSSRTAPPTEMFSPTLSRPLNTSIAASSTAAPAASGGTRFSRAW